MQPLLKVANTVRNGEAQLPWYCSGSLASAQRRYFLFDLAHLGYFPQGFADYPADESKDKYFNQWSYQSPYTRSLYSEFQSQQASAEKQLAAWYQQQYNMAESDAGEYVNKAMREISRWAFGGVPYFVQEDLVDGTEDAIHGRSDDFLDAFAAASAAQQLNSLRRLVVHQADIKLLQSALRLIKSVHYSKRAESILSNAVAAPAVLQLLLNAGFDPNQQNDFGKTALYYAIEANQPESVTQLLDTGAKINHGYQLANQNDNRSHCFAIEQWQRTPLMHAAQHADVAMIKLLIARGADVTLTDALGNRAYDYAVNAGQENNATYLASLMASTK
ncbi:hypothetical protein CHH28_07045 [Bacterioplanes sanyensis]|uniref:Uncharacterized protein n=1 Tax=Bacterioplanes sanyensis TaxID=1249553 RepID=A0A222FJN6_9GAMM|nr:ankyrin repeat domain-containing protein [Bacterioplanes sanyensis]ASP38443.1 hypothetical protein CHH28_07045 [Bacterioplanes sanyensis]